MTGIDSLARDGAGVDLSGGRPPAHVGLHTRSRLESLVGDGHGLDAVEPERARRLAIEVDGGQHGSASDERRDGFLAGRGWRVVRFWNNDVLQNRNGVLEHLLHEGLQILRTATRDEISVTHEFLVEPGPTGIHDIVASRQRVYRQQGFVAAMKDIMALQDPEIRARNLISPDDYGSIKAPTLVVWTSDDPTADVTEGRRIASMIPGARFELMPGCGHWPQYEDPKTFDRLHLDFLLGR